MAQQQTTLVCHYLEALREAGLDDSEPAGRFIYYRPMPGAFDAVREAVAGLAEARPRELARRR